jgi:F-type H+-transporting ATPase subunit 8
MNIKNDMPQLVPFYYMNEVFFTFVLIVGILYILSNYVLPRIVRLFISRVFIKIMNKI